ncbi:MAG TPA: hypothetical protein ENI76_00540, partial [Ignavibacteria bacterium]|nr:hypothetical protein [Ignavibacteria bacterium]
MAPRYIPALIIFIASIIATVYFYTEESSFIKGMNLTTGVVARLGNKSSSSFTSNDIKESSNSQALVDFTVGTSKYRAEGRALGIPRWNVGQKVGVYYSLDNPNISRINRWDELYFFTLIGVHFIVIL